MDILAVILVVSLTIVKGEISSEPPILDVSLEDGSNKIFVGEKTTFNVMVKFPGEFYSDVIFDVLPTIDDPDVFITKIKSVQVGSSLHFTGSSEAVKDYWKPELQMPFHIGKLTKAPNTRMSAPELLRSSNVNHIGKMESKSSPEDNVVLIQYEALIPEERSEKNVKEKISAIKEKNIVLFTFKYE